MSKTFRAALFAALPAAALWAAPLAAQTGGNDAGTFRVYVEGREVGTEEFTIRTSGSGVGAETVATGKVSLRLPSGSLELTPRLRASGVGADPVAYQVDIGGDAPRRITETIGGGRVSARITSGTGEQLREYVASQGAVVLEENVAHHFYFIAQRTRSGRIPVIIPSQNRQVMATVSSRGEERTQVGDVQATLFRMVVTPAGGQEHHVWVDTLGRVIKVEVPARAYLAVRTEIPR